MRHLKTIRKSLSIPGAQKIDWKAGHPRRAAATAGLKRIESARTVLSRVFFYECQHFFRMRFGLLYDGPVFDHVASRTNEDRRPDRPFDDLAVHHFFSERPVLLHHFSIRVGQQDERQFERFGKFIVRGDAVSANAEHHRSCLLEGGAEVPEAASLFGTARRVIPWIEIQNNGLAAVIRE